MSGKIAKIIDGLYIGSHHAALDPTVITLYNIRTIVNCTKRNGNPPEGMNYLQVTIDDPPSQEDIVYLNYHYMNIVKFIESSIANGNNVLVHCMLGFQRSAAIIAIYLMVKFNIDYKKAIEFIKNKKSICFLGQVNYINSLVYVQNQINDQKNSNQIANGQPPNPLIFKKNIYEQNINLCLNGQLNKVTSFPSEKVTFNSDFIPLDLYQPANVQVLNMNILQVAEMMTNNGYNPIVLNAGNPVMPCAGFQMGEYGQEESLFCKSNFFKTLDIDTGYYPINGTEGVYSPKVFVFRDDKLNFLDKPFVISFVTVAPLKNPKLTSNGTLSQEDYRITYQKIDLIFQTALRKGYDSIVLSDFACGPSHNPINQIVEMFNHCISKWRKSFKFIVFAIESKDKVNGKYLLLQNPNFCNYKFFTQNLTTQ